MRIEEQYQELLVLQEEINAQLKTGESGRINKLLLYLAQSKGYCKLKTKENQMIMLEIFCNIWLEERRQQEKIGIAEDIFADVYSLKDIECKYQMIKYAALRIENKVPEEYILAAINDLIEYKVGGIAIAKSVIRETKDGKENLITISRYLKANGMLITAITILQQALKTYEKDADMLLELAEAWLTGNQLQAAYECLVQIEEPDAQVRGLIGELEKVVGYEEGK